MKALPKGVGVSAVLMVIFTSAEPVIRSENWRDAVIRALPMLGSIVALFSHSVTGDSGKAEAREVAVIEAHSWADGIDDGKL